MKKIKYLIEAIIIYFFFIIIKLLGLNLSRFIFSKIFRLIGPIIKSEKIIDKNLVLIDSNFDKNKKKEIISKMWSNYGMTFVEYLFLDKFRYSKDFESKINLKGKIFLDKIKEKKKPVIFISGHFANFELMAMQLSKYGFNLATIYRPLNNIFLNPFMRRLRKKYICKNQIKKGLNGVRQTINHIKNKTSIALMVDQRLSEGEKLPFFKTKASTTTLPAQLALRFECKIVPVYIFRNKNNNFEMEIFEPIEVSSMENNIKNKIQLSLKINSIIEKMILKNPDQWILTHDRWR